MNSRTKISCAFLGAFALFVCVRIHGDGASNLRAASTIPLQLFTKSKHQTQTPSLTVSMETFCKECKAPQVFDDRRAIEFIADHPLEFIPKPMVKWTSYADDWNGGVGRSEFFRFYYLYVNGGIYLDHDAVLANDILSIVQDKEFVGVDAWTPNDSPYMMAGFIAARPKHPLIKTALLTLYQAESSILKNDYLYTCKLLLRIFKEDGYKSDKNVLLEEVYEHGKGFCGTAIVATGRKCVARHLFRVGDDGQLDKMDTFLKWMNLTPTCNL